MEQISKPWPQFKIKLENELVNCGIDLQQVNELINHGHNLNKSCEQISKS